MSSDYYTGTDNTLRDDMFGLSFDATQSFMERKHSLSIGSAYYLYRYNLFLGNESDDVRSFYARASTKFLKAFEARLGYEFEMNALNNFHTLDSRVTWNF